MKKKISIIVPCYNAESYIEECLTSIFNQSYENIEVIAVDNESKDSTLEKLYKIKEKYKNLIVDCAPNIHRHSWDEPREKGIHISTGDYITIICADDYIEPDYISNCMSLIGSDPQKIKALQSPIRHIRNGVSSGFQRHFYSSLKEFKSLVLNGCPVNTPTVVYNKELYEKGFLKTKPELYLGSADYDMYCSLADNKIFIYPSHNWLGYNYRWHGEQCTWGMHKEPINYDSLIQDFWKEKWKKI
jgi:glycosyltransferase involved in cell wall biosynthesis